jgi:deoxyribodipyrimidine photo-lyase
MDHDPEGAFIKKWVPELSLIPATNIHEPYKLSLIEQQMYNCELGKHYPLPIVDLEESRRYASAIVWSFKNKDEVKNLAKLIVAKHVKTKNTFKKKNS